MYHGSGHHADLKELTRAYRSLVEDSTRVMLRLKALFQARAIRTPGTAVYQPRHRAQWLVQLPDRGARQDPAWPVLRTIPFLGPVRRRALLTRRLNRNHNRVLKDVFTGAATAATGRPGPLQDFYRAGIARGVREELARVTLTRKLAALTLRLWKKGTPYDPTQLTQQAF